jgi:hypothetical protein
VAVIGVVAFGAIKVHHEVSAFAYLVTQTFEAVLLAVGAVFTLLLAPLGAIMRTGGSAGLRAMTQATQNATCSTCILGDLRTHLDLSAEWCS